ncbi:undecaprenyl-diphosphatase UppP [Parvicella tangerina]|uniref:Undecaprenyl-diphosphatase n=1 Tax=Parvicella tangerina TaxID=2829795 RepID=A0A916JP38_9FLAO|nr:undecaprenyl-diphosphatase UppP [Parvicella tangerina]CAG5085182.1 Undecaprenyl-diphosphatase [Parvicella tangerina]
MEEIIKSIILGIIQGLTEFLPVSSSGHLEIGKAILGNNLSAEESMMMTVVLHFATALSTVVIFRMDVIEIIQGLFKFKRNEEFDFSVKIILSMIPAALVGVLWDDLIETFFDGRILLVGFMLIVTGVLLIFADKAKKTEKNVSFLAAIVIGVSQAIAILPGISRSGATISTSVLLGIDRERAARFSFLMVVPLIFGKIAKDLVSDELTTEGLNVLALSVGFIAAFVTGLLACTWMIKLVKNSKLSYFAYYCFIVGLIAIVYKFVA